MCWLFAGCFEIDEVAPVGGTGGMIATGGTPSGGGAGAGAGGSFSDASFGGEAGASGDAGQTDAGDAGKVPFTLAELSSAHSGDSPANTDAMDFPLTIPTSARFLVACAHARDNDTKADIYGDLQVGAVKMTPVGPAVRGLAVNNNQAGVRCYVLDDPPAGPQTLHFSTSFPLYTYDYVRLSAFYLPRPASVLDHSAAPHSSGNQHSDLLTTSEPALVLVVYTKYWATPIETTGFTELFDSPGFGNEAEQYAAAVAQTTAGDAQWSVTWPGNWSWGGSQMLAIVPK